MTRLSWDFTGADPAPGDPAAYHRLSRDLSDTAEAAVAAYRQLQGLASGVDETIWTGSAADAFAEELAELPPQLEKLQSSYALAAEAMATYGRVLADLQHQGAGALSRLEQAGAEEAEGRRARDRALADATADALAGVPPDTAVLDRMVDDAGDRLRAARIELERIAEDRRAAESKAVAALQAASDAGLANDAWHERAWNAVDSWVDDHADILDGLSDALQVVSGIAGLLSFVPFLTPLCAPIALASGAMALGIDAALVATGNGSWASLAVDGALMALPGAGKLVSSALRPTARAGTQITRFGDDVPVTFRGDSRPPEVIFREGFAPRGTNDGLLSYATENVASTFVGTSRSSVRAIDFTGPGGYHYVIQKPGGIDVNTALGANSPYPHELEVAFRGGIEPNFLVGVNRVLADRTLGEFLPNPSFGRR